MMGYQDGQIEMVRMDIGELIPEEYLLTRIDKHISVVPYYMLLAAKTYYTTISLCLFYNIKFSVFHLKSFDNGHIWFSSPRKQSACLYATTIPYCTYYAPVPANARPKSSSHRR